MSAASCLRVSSHCNDACKPASVCELLPIESSGPRPWRRRRRLPAGASGQLLAATQSRGSLHSHGHGIRVAATQSRGSLREPPNRLDRRPARRPGRRGSAGEQRARSGGTGPYAGEVSTGPCATCRRRRRRRRLLPGSGPAGPTVAWTWVAWTCEPGPAVSPLDGGVAGRRSEDGEVAGPRVIASGRARPQFHV